jgi:hypothetical protein
MIHCLLMGSKSFSFHFSSHAHVRCAATPELVKYSLAPASEFVLLPPERFSGETSQESFILVEHPSSRDISEVLMPKHSMKMNVVPG